MKASGELHSHVGKMKTTGDLADTEILQGPSSPKGTESHTRNNRRNSAERHASLKQAAIAVSMVTHKRRASASGSVHRTASADPGQPVTPGRRMSSSPSNFRRASTGGRRASVGRRAQGLGTTEKAAVDVQEGVHTLCSGSDLRKVFKLARSHFSKLVAAQAASAIHTPASFVSDSDGGANEYNGGEKAWDGDSTTFFSAKVSSGGFTIADLGDVYEIAEIWYVGRMYWGRRLLGGRFEGATDLDGMWHCLHTITAQPATNPNYNKACLETSVDAMQHRYVRYVGPDGGNCNIADIQIYTKAKTSAYTRWNLISNSLRKALRLFSLVNRISRSWSQFAHTEKDRQAESASVVVQESASVVVHERRASCAKNTRVEFQGLVSSLQDLKSMDIPDAVRGVLTRVENGVLRFASLGDAAQRQLSALSDLSELLSSLGSMGDMSHMDAWVQHIQQIKNMENEMKAVLEEKTSSGASTKWLPAVEHCLYALGVMSDNLKKSTVDDSDIAFQDPELAAILLDEDELNDPRANVWKDLQTESKNASKRRVRRIAPDKEGEPSGRDSTTSRHSSKDKPSSRLRRPSHQESRQPSKEDTSTAADPPRLSHEPEQRRSEDALESTGFGIQHTRIGKKKLSATAVHLRESLGLLREFDSCDEASAKEARLAWDDEKGLLEMKQPEPSSPIKNRPQRGRRLSTSSSFGSDSSCEIGKVLEATSRVGSVNAGSTAIPILNASWFSAGMSLTLSDDTNFETRNVVSTARFANDTGGMVNIDTPLQSSYPNGATATARFEIEASATTSTSGPAYAGSTQISLCDTSGFSDAMCLAISDDMNSEAKTVVSVAGGVVFVDSPLQFSYATGSVATVRVASEEQVADTLPIPPCAMEIETEGLGELTSPTCKTTTSSATTAWNETQSPGGSTDSSPDQSPEIATPTVEASTAAVADQHQRDETTERSDNGFPRPSSQTLPSKGERDKRRPPPLFTQFPKKWQQVSTSASPSPRGQANADSVTFLPAVDVLTSIASQEPQASTTADSRSPRSPRSPDWRSPCTSSSPVPAVRSYASPRMSQQAPAYCKAAHVPAPYALGSGGDWRQTTTIDDLTPLQRRIRAAILEEDSAPRDLLMLLDPELNALTQTASARTPRIPLSPLSPSGTHLRTPRVRTQPNLMSHRTHLGTKLPSVGRRNGSRSHS